MSLSICESEYLRSVHFSFRLHAIMLAEIYFALTLVSWCPGSASIKPGTLFFSYSFFLSFLPFFFLFFSPNSFLFQACTSVGCNVFSSFLLFIYLFLSFFFLSFFSFLLSIFRSYFVSFFTPVTFHICNLVEEIRRF